MEHNKIEGGAIQCPHCKELIPITASLHTQLADVLKEAARQEAKKEYDAELFEKKKKWEVEAKEKAKAEVSLELKDLREQAAENKNKIEQYQEKELALLRKNRDLEEWEKNMALEVARQVAAESRFIEDKTAKRVTEEYRLKELEHEKQMSDLKKQIDDWKRKAEQGSQQRQGEVVELELEASLRSLFPSDEILPVQKGVKGPDILQKVKDGFGRECGIILWESKQTKAWSKDWVQKIKEDQRQAKAEIAVIASRILPQEIANFGGIDGVYITNFECIFGVAGVLRAQLIEVSATKRSLVGTNESMEVIWKYIHGTAFKQHVEAILAGFSAMKANLDKEKKAMTRIWAEREKHIEQVVYNTVGMYGDLQGLAGGSMPAVESLELPLLEEGGSA
jgi:hypothetical protein